MDIAIIRKAISDDRYEISAHASREQQNDSLTLADLEYAILTGEIIEDYPDDPRGPSCLISGNTSDGRPVHLVAGWLLHGWVRLITVYIPNLEKWEPDFKTRKKRCNR